jgi:hypothetical protein
VGPTVEVLKAPAGVRPHTHLSLQICSALNKEIFYFCAIRALHTDTRIRGPTWPPIFTQHKDKPSQPIVPRNVATSLDCKSLAMSVTTSESSGASSSANRLVSSCTAHSTHDGQRLQVALRPDGSTLLTAAMVYIAADAASVRAEPLRLGIGTRRYAVVPAVERADPHRVGCKRARPERSSREREPSVATAVGGQRRHGGVGRHAAKVLAATVGIEPTRAARDRRRRRTVAVGAAPASGGCAAPMKAEASPQRGGAAARAYFNSC